MFSVSSPFVRPPLPCSRDHVTEVAFTALSVHSFHYFQHIFVDVSFWLCALKICLQCIPFVPEVSQLVTSYFPAAVRKDPGRAVYGYILAHNSRAQPITVGKSWQQGLREGAQPGFA